MKEEKDRLDEVAWDRALTLHLLQGCTANHHGIHKSSSFN